jgi:hypothetical protein
MPLRRATRTQHHDLRGTIKPYAHAELIAKKLGETQLALAQRYREQRDLESAMHCRLAGLRLTFGISRPLAVRDQLHDLARQLEPSSCHPA